MKLPSQITQDLSSSMEDYLEAIGHLKKINGNVRVSDLSLFLKVKKPSVSGALNFLSKKGLVLHQRYGYVELTGEGKKLAESIQARHDMLIRFLSEILKVDAKIAKEDACKMEHTISLETFKRLTAFIQSMDAASNRKKSFSGKRIRARLKTHKNRLNRKK